MVLLLVFLGNLILLLLRFPCNFIIDSKDEAVDGLNSVIDEVVDVVREDEGCCDIHKKVLTH
jgi:hypothetical protein